MQVVIPRTLEGVIKARLGTGKAIIIMGARQVGKTTLLKQMFSNVPDAL
jgi:predicted AAA+ superfamily ATPase